MTLVAVDDLTIAYRTPEGEEVRAVDGVSFAVAAGETLGIVGESGCGKSTISRALLGHLRPGSYLVRGAVRLEGTSLIGAAPARLRSVRGGTIALVPQQPLSALTPHIRVGGQVAEVIAAHRAAGPADRRAEVLRLFARARLPDPPQIAGRYPHEISGGQRQRVAIAAALAGRPRCLVLDEPTTALDKTTEAEVLRLVADLRSETGAALIYVSHDLRVIREICARVLVMRDGRIVEDGPVSRVFAAPRTAYGRELLAAVPNLAHLSRRPPPAAAVPPRPARLDVRGLGFAYPEGRGPLLRRRQGPPVLSGVSFRIGRGEAFGLIGESGSGKSTLAGLIAGLVSGAAGEMRFDGQPLAGRARTRPPDLRRRIQLVFQDPAAALNPAHSVESIVARPLRRFFGKGHAEARAEAARLVASLDLDPALLGRRPSELSGGQQQRVAIARALAAARPHDL